MKRQLNIIPVWTVLYFVVTVYMLCIHQDRALAFPAHADTIRSGHSLDKIAASDTTRYTFPAGDRAGERLVWRDENGAYVQHLSFGGRELNSRILPGSDGLPRHVEITGTHPGGVW